MAIVNYLSVDFEASPRIIWIDTTASQSISAQNLVDTCMHLCALPANMDDAILLESSGKEYLVADGSVKVGLTITLNNAKIAFRSLGGPLWILCSIEGGNVVAVENVYNDPRIYIPVVHPTPFITIERVSSSSATLSDLDAIQYSSYGGGVSLDIINGQPGTVYPVGNQEFPSNNLADSVIIADTKGFKTIFVRESMSMDSGTDVSNFTLVGRSHVLTVLTIEDSLICPGLTIKNCNVTGILDGGTHIYQCSVGDLNYVNGNIYESGLYGLVTLGGNEEAVIANCFTVDQDSPLIIDMGGSGQDLALPNYSGIVTIKNLDSTSEEIGVGLNSGMVILDETLSAGSIIVSGVGILQDNSTGSAIVNTDGLMSKQTISEAVYDEIGTEIQYASYNGGVTIDVENGVSGTDYNIGTPGNPSSNLNDAVLISNDTGVDTLFINKSMSIDSSVDISGYKLIGKSKSSVTILIDSTNTSNNITIQNCNLSGVIDGGSLIENCSIGSLDFKYGTINYSSLYGEITLSNNRQSKIFNCVIHNYDSLPSIDMGGSGQSLLMRNFSGLITFKNFDSTSEDIGIGLDAGVITLDHTITAGYIIISGTGTVIDNSHGAIVNTNGLISKELISEAVYDEIGTEIQYASYNGGVTIDVENGVSGTDYNIGTPGNPSSNIPEAVIIARNNGFNKLYINGNITFGAGDILDNFEVYGAQATHTSITIDSTASVTGSLFYDAVISGVLDGNSTFERCYIGDLEYLSGRIYLCTLVGTIILSGTSNVRIINCFDGLPGADSPVIDCGGAGRGLNIEGYTGGIRIKNKTGSDEASILIKNGNVILDNTVTNGNITVSGIGILENNASGSAKVYDHIIDKTILDNIDKKTKLIPGLM